jgi:hypothetical protein
MNSKESLTWQTRFELKEIEKKNDGAVFVTVTILSRVPGTETSETVSNDFWKYKNGQLFDVFGVELTERNPETDLVLAAIKARGYN